MAVQPFTRTHSALSLFAASNASPVRAPGKSSLGADSLDLHRSSTFYVDLVDDRKGNLEHYRSDPDDLKDLPRKIRQFYEDQNEQLDKTESVETTPLVPKRTTRIIEAEKEDRKIRFAINVNLTINVLLLAGKIAAVFLSNSISLTASAVDSAMDLLSTIIIAATATWARHRSAHSDWKFPVGKRKLEPLGIIVFSVFMQASFIQVFIESVQRFFAAEPEPLVIPRSGLAIMWLTIVVKSIVWFWCRMFKSASVRALAQDAENDVVFNVFSLAFPWAGALLNYPKLDAIGGILLSVYIIVDWSNTLLETATSLAGRRATASEHNRVIYLLTRFSRLVKAIQHVSVYHVGEGVIVECDIILSQDTPLVLAHNLGESIQMALESLSNVDRAYVHVDYQPNPATGHRK